MLQNQITFNDMPQLMSDMIEKLKELGEPFNLYKFDEVTQVPDKPSEPEKPEEVANRIAKMFPTQKKIELFSRRKRKGWDVWGLDVMNKSTYKTQAQINYEKLKERKDENE